MNPLGNLSSQAPIGGALEPNVPTTGSDADKLQAFSSLTGGDAYEGVESVFLSMLMKEMRNTLSEGGLFGSENSDTYGGLFDMMMSQSMAAGTPLGIGAMVKSALERNHLGLNSTDEFSLGNVLPESNPASAEATAEAAAATLWQTLGVRKE